MKYLAPNSFKISLLSLLLVVAFSGFGQQQWQYSQYMNNNFLLNPAEGGTEEFTDIKVGGRLQWVGLSGAPTSMFVSAHHPLNKNREDAPADVKPMSHHGVGGYISNDQTGPTSRLSAYGSYSYHLPVTRKLTVSFGAFLGVKQYSLDAAYLDWETDAPDAAVQGANTDYVPDASFGIWAYHENWYFGASSFQLFQNKLDVGTVNSGEVASLSMHHFITAGYKIPVSEKVFVVPSVVAKGVKGAPMQFDVNAKVRYEDKFWGGLSYRNKDAIVFLIGATLKNQFDVGYSYDLNISNLNNFNGGSHEILLGYRWHHTDDIVPAQFW